jgi:peptide-methionine (S)-S-oxide reductase
MRTLHIARCLALLTLGACQDNAPRPPAQGSTSGGLPPSGAAQANAGTAETTPTTPSEAASTMPPTSPESNAPLGLATFGAGCFWCVEAVLEQLEGVRDVRSGYMGGSERPTYKQVSSGTTRHAEVVQVDFDPSRISYETLLSWFWKLHDPTTLNRQGADVGPQYRSVIFYHDEAQRLAAIASKAAAQADFKDPIVTEISPALEYYPGEDYHQDYYRNNKNQGYCRAVIAPKLKKLELEH